MQTFPTCNLLQMVLNSPWRARIVRAINGISSPMRAMHSVSRIIVRMWLSMLTKSSFDSGWRTSREACSPALHTSTCESETELLTQLTSGVRTAQFVQHQICDWKAAILNPSGSSMRIFFSSSLSMPSLIPCPFHPCVTAVAVKDPSHSAKSAVGRSHVNMYTSLT